MIYSKRHKSNVRKQKTTKRNIKHENVMTNKKNDYENIIGSIDIFNYATESDQAFKSKKEVNEKLEKNIKLLKKSIDDYIQKRRESINNAMILQ